MTEQKQSKKLLHNRAKIGSARPQLYLLMLFFFFISGITGLVYEILWTRMIEEIIGNAPFAVSIILTIFMGGLGLGSYLASRFIDRITNTRTLIRLYGTLELIIGAYGLLLPLFLTSFRPMYVVLYNRLFEHFYIYNLLTFLGCAVLLVLPALCMGATLPVLSRFAITSISKVGSHVGRLYGINTIGAALGSLICGFWIIHYWGMTGSLVFAVFLNTGIGVLCILVSSKSGKAAELREIRTTVQNSEKEQISDIKKYVGYGALVIFAVSGFCSMSYEVIWTKLLGLIVGPTTYSFTIVLTTFIAGLAIGSIFFGWYADKTNKPFSLLLYTQIAAALSALFISHIMGNSQIFFAKLIYEFQENFTGLEVMKAVVLFLFMIVPTFFLGAAFPLVGKIYTRSITKVGRSIGFAYSINTIGAVLGSFCAGFIMIPFFGKESGLRIVVILQLLSALGIGSIVYWKTHNKNFRWAPLIIPSLLGFLFIFHFPHWNRSMLSIGKYHRFDKPELVQKGWLETLFFDADDYKRDIVYFGDGIGGFTAVSTSTNIFGKTNFSLFNSGKSDASTFGDDMVTQTMLAHFPMLFHPKPEQVMVLGFASGITAGEVLHYPVEKLDILEINSQVVAASNYFIPWNNNVLANPKTELIIQDGRAHLELTNRMYDVIISEPSNPWMAGLASLFTRDFFETALKHLNKNGIFVQWIHSYQMNWQNFALIGRTFSEIFPNSVLVSLEVKNMGLPDVGTDFLLVGFNGAIQLDQNVALKNLYYAQKSKNMRLLNHLTFYSLIAHEDLKSLFGEGPINTEKRPILEFSVPKMMFMDDKSIPQYISTKRWISPEIRNTIELFNKDIDNQIDFIEFALSFIPPYENMIELSQATPAQRERFINILETYCSENVITDFSFIKDEEILKRCIVTQIEAMNERTSEVSDKLSLYNHLGRLSYTSGMHDRAAEFYSKAVQIDPNNDETYYMIGNIQFARNRLDEAIISYKKSLSIQPNSVMTHNNLGNVYATLNEFDLAITQYREALKINPDFAIIHKNLGIILQRTGKREEGERHLREALRIDPESIKSNTQ